MGTNETAATRNDQNQHRARTKDKVKHYRRKRGTAKVKGDTIDQTATNLEHLAPA